MIDEAIRAAVADAVAASEARIIAAVVAEIRRAQPPRLLSVHDAAVELGISECSVRRHVADGSLPSRRVGARVLVDLSTGDGGPYMQNDALPGSDRRGLNADATDSTPHRRRGGTQP